MENTKCGLVAFVSKKEKELGKEICAFLERGDFHVDLVCEGETGAYVPDEAPMGVIGIGIHPDSLAANIQAYQSGIRAVLLLDPVMDVAETGTAAKEGLLQKGGIASVILISQKEGWEERAATIMERFPSCQIKPVPSADGRKISETAASFFARRAKYRKLFSPIRVGNVLLKNRLIAAPITKYGYQPAPAEALEEIAAKARGGAALILLGSTAVDDEKSLIYYEASSLDGYRKPLYNEEISLTHQYGALASLQLLHCGMWADMRNRKNVDPIGPDTRRREGSYQGLEGIENNQIMDGKMINGLDEAGMQKVCDQYAHAAATAKKMGFDMVMLHFAHGWLPAEFMSPFFNHRTDEYGGSFENRIRFPLRIVEAVRKAVGRDYPIDMRIGAEEYVDGGIKAEEVIQFLALIQDKIDMVHISSGLDKFAEQTAYIESPSLLPHQINVKYAEMAKKTLHIPVVTVGGITMPQEAEEILESGKADIVALGRGLVADPDWMNKAAAGHSEMISPCLRCCSCYSVATEGISQGCAVNPEYGRKLRLTVENTFSTDAGKRIVVIGGGPAGMKAAVTAAERGNKVWLLEKEDRLGGVLKISDGDLIKRDMNQLMKNLIRQVENSTVEVLTGCEASPEYVKRFFPDRVITAVGSVPLIPGIPGVDRDNVIDIISAHRREETIGKRVIIIGAGPSGCELAISLAQKGREVHLVEMSDKIASEGNHLYRSALDIRFREFENIHVHTGTACKEIRGDGIYAACVNRNEVNIPGDTVVLAVGMRSRRELAESFMGLECEVSMVGDCIRPRRINEAIHEGYFAGWR